MKSKEVNRAARSPFALPKLAAFVIALVGLIALGSCPVHGQGFAASITGTVADTSGAVLPGARVTVKNLETGLTRAVEVDASGNYTIPSLPVGAYELTAEKLGFEREVRRGINLVVAQEAAVNLTLQVGSVVQQVTVTEAAPLVNATTTSTSGLISEQQIKELPLNGRSFDQLLTLNVGTVNNSANVTSANPWTAFSVAGKRPETNRFLINGIDYVGVNATGTFITPLGSSGQLLGVDGVREYNVVEHTYGAEYGKRAGGQISIVTSSGTNQLHGDVFEYLRNSGLDARNFFDYPPGIRIPPFKRNQFGGALGGPLKRDEFFLFGNYEGFRQRLGLPLVSNVPDAAARRGFLPCNVVTATPTFVKPRCSGSELVNVNTAPGMLPYAQYFWPEPNGPELLVKGLPSGIAQNFSNPLQKVREDFGLIRFDSNLSTKDSFSANYTLSDGETSGSNLNPVFSRLNSLRSQTLGLQETHVFSPILLNVSNVGFSRAFAPQVQAPAIPGQIPSELLFVTGGNPGSIILGGAQSAHSPSAITGADGNNPFRAVRNYFTGSDDLRWTRGNHFWSAGMWIQRVQENMLGASVASAGQVTYSTLQTFLQDRPIQFIGNLNPLPSGYRSTEGAWYIQDEMKLRSNLTLRLGLRDEFTTGWNEEAGRCSNYIFGDNGVILTDPRIADSCLQENNAKALWQPRVGLAWDPTGTGSWAVRAGFGIHNDLQDNLAHRVYADPPFNARLAIGATPLLSIIPLALGTPAPPSCHVAGETNCAIFQPGGIDPNMHTPTIQQWSFTVERAITKDMMLQLSYVGMESYHLPTAMDTNVPHPQACPDPLGCLSGGTLASGKPYSGPPVRVPQGTTYIPPQPRPNPFVSSTLSWFFLGTANYQGGNVSLVKRATRGLAFKANYSFSKLIDINSALVGATGLNEPPNVVDPYDLGLSRGIGAYSLTHQFNGNFTYQLPFGNGQRFGNGASGWVDKLIGGWQWNGIVTAQSGFPFTPLVGSNISGTGDPSQSDTPNRNPDFKGTAVLGVNGFKKTGQYFDPAAFSLPLAGTFGNVARGSFIGPQLFDVDTSLFKKFSIKERYSLQFRAEAFNLFNHTNFGEPNEVIFSGNNSSGTAGVISTTATTSRQIQFALKLLF